MTVISVSEIIPKLMLAQDVAVDTETSGLKPYNGNFVCAGSSVALREGDEIFSSYFPLNHLPGGNIDAATKDSLFSILKTRKRIIFHGAKFDLAVLKTENLDLSDVLWYCTELMAHMLNENKPKSLDFLSKIVLGREGKKKNELWENWHKICGWNLSKFPVEAVVEYACVDTEETLLLFEEFYPWFVKSGFDGQA